MNSSSPDGANTLPDNILDALIIGAGFSGIYQLYSLRNRLGLNVKVVEAGDDLGGTWYWNRYPGARCDSESHSYCYTFSEELARDWEFSERYPGPPEILRYLNYVADRLDLKKDIHFSQRVRSAHFNDARAIWEIRTEGGQQYSARFLITAVGCLSSANVPDIEGLDSFEGRWYHTGQWPHEGVDFSGKRVAQIGTGSTGIQAAPVIAETAAHLTVFQRTANYSVPAHNAPLTEEFKQYVKENFANIRATTHQSANGHSFLISETRALDITEQQRQQRYEAAWAKGGLEFRATFQDLVTDKAANDTAAEFIKAKIRSIVKDPLTASRLSNIDHPYAAKRPPIDSFYFESFNRENVTLVDLKATPIKQITDRGIRTSDTEYPVDIIVFATGFDAMTGSLLRIDIRGRHGLRLADAWNAGPQNYLGLQVAGFPNMFTVTGPGSPSVLCNMPVAIEQHVDWITDCIRHMRENDIVSVEAEDNAMDRWVKQVNAAADVTLLPQATHSWYLGANVPGKPNVFMPYAGGMNVYRRICDDVARENYKGFLFKH